MKTKKIRPSDLKDWSQIDHSKARIDSSKNVEWYGWYPYSPSGFKSDIIFMPHRKPTLEEMDSDKFN